MAREVVLVTPEHVEVQFELAGIGSRFIAMLIDTLIQSAVMVVVVLAFIAMGVLSIYGSCPGIWLIAVLVIIVFAVYYGYFLFFEAVRNGQTPGKKAAGIRVVRDTGHPVDFRSALLRNVMRIVDSLPGAYGVGIVSVFFSPQYRRLGDYVAGTLVVKVGRRPEMMSRAAAPVEPAAAPAQVSAPPPVMLPPSVVPLVSSITKDEYRAVRHFLDRRHELEINVVRDLSIKLAGPLAQKLQVDPVEIGDPLAFLQSVSAEWERQVVH